MRATPGKRWNIGRRKTATKNIGADIHNGTGIKHRVDATLTVIAHH